VMRERWPSKNIVRSSANLSEGKIREIRMCAARKIYLALTGFVSRYFRSVNG